MIYSNHNRCSLAHIHLYLEKNAAYINKLALCNLSTKIPPEQFIPSPVNPSKQSHRKNPLRLMHLACSLQLCLFSEHSSISIKI